MAKRTTLTFELTRSAKTRLAKLSDYHGMTEMAMMGRLMEWFVKQGENVHTAALCTLPHDSRAEVAKLLLKRMEQR